MKLSWIGKAFLVSLFTVTPAQTYFCIAGNLDTAPPAEIAACKAKLANMRTLVRMSGTPADWHYIMVCDEAAWRSLAALSRTPMLHLAQTTDSRERVTLIHGSSLPAGNQKAVQDVLGVARLQTGTAPADARPTQPGHSATEVLTTQGGW